MQKLQKAYVLEGITSSGHVAESLKAYGFADEITLFHSLNDLVRQCALGENAKTENSWDVGLAGSKQTLGVVFISMAALNAELREAFSSILKGFSWPVVIVTPRLESDDFDTFIGEPNVFKLLHTPLKLDYLIALSYQLNTAARKSNKIPLSPPKHTQLEPVFIEAGHS
jgi:hypothetical protein